MYRISQAAKLLGVTPKTLRVWERQGKIHRTLPQGPVGWKPTGECRRRFAPSSLGLTGPSQCAIIRLL